MDSAILLERVSKSLGNRKILNDVSFSVERGDIFGYLGPNGAGKTTSIRVILGLLKANSGKVSILGHDVSADEKRRQVGFVLESDGLYDYMTAYENIYYYAQIYGMSRPKDRIENVLKLVNLWDRVKDKVKTYSKGMRQRLALARAMVHNPEVLILDEPTSGLDPSGQIEVRQIILDLAHKEGRTIFLSSHNLDEVQRICNRIALIDKGGIKLYGVLDELQRERGQREVVVETAEVIAGPVFTGLSNLPGVSIRNREDRTLILSIGIDTDVSSIVNFLTKSGVRIEQVKRKEASMEELYTAILKGEE
jgi:ABC-2 type transport system ATP-binding protein